MHHYSKLGENALRKGSRHLRTTLSYQIIPNQNKQNIYTPTAVKNEDSNFDDNPMRSRCKIAFTVFRGKWQNYCTHICITIQNLERTLREKGRGFLEPCLLIKNKNSLIWTQIISNQNKYNIYTTTAVKNKHSLLQFFLRIFE